MADPLLKDLLPELATEIEGGLRAAGRPELAAQVESLELVSRCDCSLADCGTFSTVARPVHQWATAAGSVAIRGRGMIVVDAIDNVLDAQGRVIIGEPSPRITSIEILEREDVHDALIALGIPTTPRAPNQPGPAH